MKYIGIIIIGLGIYMYATPSGHELYEKAYGTVSNLISNNKISQDIKETKDSMENSNEELIEEAEETLED